MPRIESLRGGQFDPPGLARVNFERFKPLTVNFYQIRGSGKFNENGDNLNTYKHATYRKP